MMRFPVLFSVGYLGRIEKVNKRTVVLSDSDVEEYPADECYLEGSRTILSIRIQRTPHECPQGTDAGFAHTFPTPKCVLRPGGSITVSWPVDKQIDLHGPYDAESFPDKRAKVAVICPEEFVGEAGQFLRQLKDGINSADEHAPFRKGFVRKYHLNACDFTFHEVKRAATSLEDGYKAASLAALRHKKFPSPSSCSNR